jgi:uncharacterized protein YciI
VSNVPQVDLALDDFELVVLRVGDKAEGMEETTVRRLQAEHIAFLFGLQREGKLLAAGAVARAPGQEITGIGFFAVGSVDEVRALVEKDPSVIAGLDSAEVLSFMCPKGAITFPNAG